MRGHVGLFHWRTFSGLVPYRKPHTLHQHDFSLAPDGGGNARSNPLYSSMLADVTGLATVHGGGRIAALEAVGTHRLQAARYIGGCRSLCPFVRRVNYRITSIRNPHQWR
jgi:hypothetical protein